MLTALGDNEPCLPQDGLVTTWTPDDPEDPQWRFDLNNLPPRFTKRMLGRMSIAQLRMCADPETSPLNESQQESFDAAYAELNREIRGHIGSAVPKVVLPAAFNFDFNALFPKINTAAFLSSKVYEGLNESTRASFERMSSNLIRNLDAAQIITATAPGLPSPPPTRSDEPETSESGETPTTEPEVSGLSDVTPDEVVKGIDESLDDIAQLSAVVQLLEEQRDVTRRQQETAARGFVFYVVVGLGSALSGIATVVGLGTWPQRFWALGLTALLAVVAVGAYVVVRGKQKRDSAQS